MALRVGSTSRSATVSVHSQKRQADGGDACQVAVWVSKKLNSLLECIETAPDQTNFRVLPHRRVVARTFVWVDREHRLSKDDEQTPAGRESIV